MTITSTNIKKWFPVRTAQSQHPNVCKHYVSLDGMQINIICCKPHTLSLKPFKFFFQPFHWFLWLRSSFIKWYETEQNIKLHIHNGGWHETLNLLHVIRRKMLHFMMSYMNQHKKRKQTLESVQYGLKIIFNHNNNHNNLQVDQRISTTSWLVLCVHQSAAPGQF